MDRHALYGIPVCSESTSLGSKIPSRCQRRFELHQAFFSGDPFSKGPQLHCANPVKVNLTVGMYKGSHSL